MVILSSIRSNKPLIIVTSLIFLNILIIVSIFFINKSPSPIISGELKGYDEIEKAVLSLSSDPVLSDNKHYKNMVDDLEKLRANNLSKKQRVTLARLLIDDFGALYAETNDHSLYQLGNDIKNFVEPNFGKDAEFNPPCLDPICADRPQPEAIMTVINQIQEADLPESLKHDHIKDLTNYGYFTKDYDETRTQAYLFTAADILDNKSYIKAGINKNISDQIIEYVKKDFPEEYLKITQQ